MSTQSLHALLGHLMADAGQDFDQLQQWLTRSMLPAETERLTGTRFSMEGADLFAPENIPEARAALLQTIGPREEEVAPEFRVFARETPVRSTQVAGSVPLWAAGAAVEKTIGPFTHLDGRSFWFDFFRIEKLVALYVQGRPDPALLFKVNVGWRWLDAVLPLVADPSLTYQLAGGSVWINSQLLAASAPAGTYTGLTIESGAVTLSAPPQIIGGKLTVSPSTVVTVRLRLHQPTVSDADPTSPFGVDARAAALQLPRQFDFHFSQAGSAFEAAGKARWELYGDSASFHWLEHETPIYDALLHRVLIPYVSSSTDFTVRECKSPLQTARGSAPIQQAAWALPAGTIDVANPSPAAGIGAMLVKCAKGLAVNWQGLQGAEVQLNQPYVMAEPGRIALSDLLASGQFCTQRFALWRDKQNPFGTSVDMRFPAATPYFYNTFANGNEAVAAFGHADVQVDRPVTVSGEALAIHSKYSFLLLAANKAWKLIYLYDDNILFDAVDLSKQPLTFPQPIALALRNALFKTTQVNGCLLFGQLADDFIKVQRGVLFLTLGTHAYLPTLPDPYAANLGALRWQFRGNLPVAAGTALSGQSVWMWLVCRIRWVPGAEDNDRVNVSFHFAPLQNQFQLPTTTATTEAVTTGQTVFTAASIAQSRLPDYDGIWDNATRRLQQDYFALLDVSTNADLLGVSFGTFGWRELGMITTHVAAPTSNEFPLQVQGMDVVSRANNVRAFTVPQISWEPVFNLTPPSVPGDPNAFFNYYANDGGPTRILNNSQQTVALAPLPLTDLLVNAFAHENDFAAFAFFTLPFGLKALALLRKQYEYGGIPRQGNEVLFNSKSFPNDLTGARQLELDGGDALVEGESDMFMGCTVQLNNILEMDGTAQGNSTLGASVTKIFNNEFLLEPFDLLRQRGVPLTRIDLSGYGASTFSNWLNPKATIAATSQAKFDVFVGRCAHEIIQVKSILYPWAIKVVRTITLFRTATGYVYRFDSGWRAESDGRFDFTYFVNVDDPANPGKLKPEERQAPYGIHPGVIKGLFNVKEIKETTEIEPFKGQMAISNGGFYVDENGKERQNTSGSDMLFNVEMQPVFFNADVEVEGAVSGFAVKKFDGAEKRVVASKRILGFVQLAPRGMPLTSAKHAELILRQGTIGGSLDCVVNIADSGQQMRLNRFDVSNSVAANHVDPVFVAAGRGSVILPKDGSWGMVKHEHGTGEVTPVPPELSVPLIRIGAVVKVGNALQVTPVASSQLLRIANPTELLRTAVSATINYGLLHSTDTQKALILTPAFKQGFDRLLSKTPPLFADAFRIVNSKGVFPNIGDAVTNFGDVISLVKSGTEFLNNAMTDGGQQVRELMKIGEAASSAGYKLLKQVEKFDLPNTEWKLIEIGGAFKIYIEYKADNLKTQGGGTKNQKGSLDFDIDSFAADVANRWKSRMANVALVVDLGPIKRLMTIKGNWDAHKGAEAEYKGNAADPDFPSPQIEFAPELKPVIEILQILQDLQGENYKGAFQRGLKLAMSNKAASWEYKFEAAKEIPVVRFPMPNEVYNNPNTPLKLEAGLKLGAYFNAALKVTTDPKQLLPTAGGFMEFYGRLSVMCVSLSAATVYAVGQVNLRIAADTKVGPSLAMKFGFGAQIVVGLPVVGNVSLLYMVGVEIYVDSVKLNISAFLLFQGHAELLGGLVGVTVTIEAKGTISRQNILVDGEETGRTDLAAQVTFGLDISIFWVIDISFSESWQEQRQIA